MKLQNPCAIKTDKCLNCHNNFQALRPRIEKALVTKHFMHEVPNYEEILNEILDCAHLPYHELHKYEKKINGISVFRAKKDRIHYKYLFYLLQYFYNQSYNDNLE